MSKIMSRLFLDQLDPARRRAFDKLAVFSDRFTLAGGTAIMLLAGHRRSYDFDCFTLEELPENFLSNDIQIVETVFLKKSYTPEEIKTFLEKQVDDYLKTILPQK